MLLLAIVHGALAQAPPKVQAPPKDSGALTIESIYAEGGLLGRAPEMVQWSPDGAKLSFIQRDDAGERAELWYVDVASGKRAVLVASEKLATLVPPVTGMKNERERERRLRYSVAAYQWAPDSKHLLFDADGQLWLYSPATATGVALTSSPEPAGDAKFSPDGARISYIRGHNLYLRSINGKRETAITHEAGENILNGEVDWVYAEELEVRSNYFWSPNGKQIVFLQMNETHVPEYPITDWMPVHPTVDRQRYPKAGDPNPEVRLGVVGTDGGRVKWIELGGAGNSPTASAYIPRFGWVRDGLLYAQGLNRAQNKLDLYFIDAASGRSRLVLSETSDAWINVNDDFRILKSGDGFLWSSWRDGHTHLYLYHFNKAQPLEGEATLEKQLTSGDYEVSGVEAVEEEPATETIHEEPAGKAVEKTLVEKTLVEKRSAAGGERRDRGRAGYVYFQGNRGDERQQHIYRAGLNGEGLTQISREPGWHSPTFAPAFARNGARYVDNFSALMEVPSLAICQVEGSCARFWQARDVKGLELIEPRFVDFKADDGTTLRGLLLLPPQNDANKKIPLLLNPYGGPGSQSVKNYWGSISFFDQLLARDGIAILKVDNRGMAGRGKKFARVLQRNFGETELRDQLSATAQLRAAYPQLDRNRLGWWGWSYGGYMTLYALTHSQLFKVGVAGAPVTDWRDYDSIYTERYMGLPGDNRESYRRSSPVNFAAQLHGRLLLIHGTGDDNVHVQNTIQMVQALIDAQKQFDLALYPKKTHGISGAAARTHLYHHIRRHIEAELLGATREEDAR